MLVRGRCDVSLPFLFFLLPLGPMLADEVIKPKDSGRGQKEAC